MGAPNNDKFETDPTVEENSREIKLRQGLLTVPISHLDPRRALHLPPTASVAEAVDLMNRENIGAVLVVAGIGADVRLVGIFTERDVLTKIAGRGLDFTKIRVEAYMTRDPETLGVDAKVAYALNMMVVGGFRHVPLVDRDHRPVAMISVRDIVEYMVELFPKDILNLPIDPNHEAHNQFGG
jgi:CBS domain-containing protein